MAKKTTALAGNNGLLGRLMAGTTSKHTAEMDKSDFFKDLALVETPYPIVNIAFSGSINGGFSPGVHVLAGPSKNFKSNLGILMMASYMRKYKDAVCLFYDNEFGSVPGYFKSLGVDTSRVIHTPITTVEELRHDIAVQLENIQPGDKVFIFIDSIGMLASEKEKKDAEDGKTTADMTRARALKSMFRICTSKTSLLRIPLVVIAHTYETMEMFSKQVVSGGKGSYYAANTVMLMGRSQEKANNVLEGYRFNMVVDKSRSVREKSKLPLVVSFENGINKYSGLLDLAIESGFVVSPSQAWYSRCTLDKGTGELVREEKKWRAKDTSVKEFWDDLLEEGSGFYEWVEERFKLSSPSFEFDDEDIDDILDGDDE